MTMFPTILQCFIFYTIINFCSRVNEQSRAISKTKTIGDLWNYRGYLDRGPSTTINRLTINISVSSYNTFNSFKHVKDRARLMTRRWADMTAWLLPILELSTKIDVIYLQPRKRRRYEEYEVDWSIRKGKMSRWSHICVNIHLISIIFILLRNSTNILFYLLLVHETPFRRRECLRYEKSGA